MSQMKFPRKGYGRLFVEKEEDIEKIKEIMKEIDPDEFEGYFFDDLIAVFSTDDCKAAYTHKFDEMDIGEVLPLLPMPVCSCRQHERKKDDVPQKGDRFPENRAGMRKPGL